jgi:hypothetical protein
LTSDEVDPPPDGFVDRRFAIVTFPMAGDPHTEALVESLDGGTPPHEYGMSVEKPDASEGGGATVETATKVAARRATVAAHAPWRPPAFANMKIF